LDGYNGSGLMTRFLSDPKALSKLSHPQHNLLAQQNQSLQKMDPTTAKIVQLCQSALILTTMHTSRQHQWKMQQCKNPLAQRGQPAEAAPLILHLVITKVMSKPSQRMIAMKKFLISMQTSWCLHHSNESCLKRCLRMTNDHLCSGKH